MDIYDDPPNMPYIDHVSGFIERELVSYVEHGRPDLMRKAVEDLMNDDQGVPDVSPNADRAFKNIFIFATGIISRAALRGGLDYDTVNEAATYYLTKIEEKTGYAQISRLIGQMFISFSNMVAMINQVPLNSMTANKIKQTIFAHMNEKITPTMIASILNMDVSYLCRHFKKEAGVTISSYINTVKISECKRLLAATDMNIADISARLGYTSQNYMSDVFKKITGTTPDAYRRAEYKPENV